MPRGPLRVLLRFACLLALLGASPWPARADDRHKAGSKKHGAGAPAKKKADHKAPEDTPAPSEVPGDAKRGAQEPSQPAEMQTRGPTRLDFDDRTIQGQGSKVGAVYLYDRKNLPLRSMVRKRESFRDQIGSDEVSGAVVE